ncbi:MAG: phosphomannomutase/phosphoglucomutase [Parcubacteria group bacterium]|nr:phosphomannomutase/phosphoglucomutase [Parcubacteria group bacterium]
MNLVNPKIFRAYDIRGVYPQDLNEKTAYQIGRAFAAYLKESKAESPEKIAVGRDARISSPILSRSFISGITDEGINVLDIGQVTVDMAYFASGYFHIPAAMVTASHNPKEYNGFKLMKKDVEFIGSSSGLEEIKRIITGESPLPRFKSERGKVIEQSILNQYLNHVLNFIDIDALRPMRVAIDTGSGAVGPVIKKVLEKIPIDYTPLYFAPDGDFPYREPNPSLKNNLGGLIGEVKTHHYHFGCAFDGDGDRIIFVDENGETINPSIIGALMARYLLKKNHYGKIIYVAVASRIIEDVARAYNGTAIREKVGHTYIAKRMCSEDGILGIETSGHYFFKNNFYADSGIISFLTMLQILSQTNKSLSVLAGEIAKYVSIAEINLKADNPDEFIKKIAQNFEGYEMNWLDGLTVETSDFWLNIRPSNTEPLVRLNIEAKDEIILNRVKKDIEILIERYK